MVDCALSSHFRMKGERRLKLKRIYQVLVVDDEEHIVQSVSALLESNGQHEVELFSAHSASAAISILQRRRIDILITDIQMPGYTGVQLARIVRQRWPDCKTIVFTAHADFQLARDTLREGVMGYVLKADPDEALMREFFRAVEAVDEELSRLEQFSSLPPQPDVDVNYLMRRALRDLLHGRCEEDFEQLLGSLGPFLHGSELVLVCAVGGGTAGGLEFLMERYLSQLAPFRIHDQLDNRQYWLIQPSAEGMLDAVVDALTIVAENCCTRVQEGVALLVAGGLTEAQHLHAAWQRMQAYPPQSSTEAFVHVMRHDEAEPYANRVVSLVIKHIENNISGDLSLTALARVASYNASYLSRLFMETTGITLSAFIAGRRMEHISQLLCDETLSLNQIAEAAGFENRSYFNRFVKRMTGLSPLQLRKSRQRGEPD